MPANTFEFSSIMYDTVSVISVIMEMVITHRESCRCVQNVWHFSL